MEAFGDFIFLGDLIVLGDLGVLVVDFLLLGDLVAGVDFLPALEPRPDGVLGDFRGFFALNKESVDFRFDPVPREVGRAFLPGELEAVFAEADDPAGVTKDSRLA